MIMAKLGDLVKDRITGMEGIIMARSEYLYDSPSVGIFPTESNNGANNQWKWIPEAQASILKECAIKK